MNRKRVQSPSVAGAGSSATDIMTSLIGVMMMILIGILLTSAVGQAALEFTAEQPADTITSPGESLGYAESRAFPHFSGVKQAVYLDVHGDRVVMLHASGESEVIPAGELSHAANALVRRLDDLSTRREKEYIVLLLRPGAARLGRNVRDLVRDRGLDVGVDLLISSQSPVPSRRRDSLPLNRHPSAPSV